MWQSRDEAADGPDAGAFTSPGNYRESQERIAQERKRHCPERRNADCRRKQELAKWACSQKHGRFKVMSGNTGASTGGGQAGGGTGANPTNQPARPMPPDYVMADVALLLGDVT